MRPKVWKDVVNPKWKGKIILSDPQISVNWGGWLKVTHDALGDDFLKALATQGFQVVASTATGAQQVAAGAKALNFPTANTFAAPLQAQGAPIDYVFMSDPIIVNRFNFGAGRGGAASQRGKTVHELVAVGCGNHCHLHEQPDHVARRSQGRARAPLEAFRKSRRHSGQPERQGDAAAVRYSQAEIAVRFT